MAAGLSTIVVPIAFRRCRCLHGDCHPPASAAESLLSAWISSSGS